MDCGDMSPLWLHGGQVKALAMVTVQPKRSHASVVHSDPPCRPPLLITPGRDNSNAQPPRFHPKTRLRYSMLFVVITSGPSSNLNTSTDTVPS